ncbi:MAG: hypothetical protein KBC41_02810 [Candidatus Pacebacteria bacterium]|nr:hypothetical protein [Candidatus Paceibacterota bacterium]MBP9866985.1 hypothetical protein [Candidatus Paceibacterota bacterium]
MKQKKETPIDEEKVAVKKPRVKKTDGVKKASPKIDTKKSVTEKEVKETKEKDVPVTHHTHIQATTKTVEVSKVSLKRQSKMVLKNILLSKHFHVLVKLSIAFSLVLVCLYGFYVYVNHATENNVVVSQSEIIDRIKKLTPLPNVQPLAIVRVEDPERLKRQNVFYENVKIGDYVVMYEDTAVIYDLRNNAIVALKKVRAR